MTTPSERLEATIWLDATYPELPAEQRAAYYAAVDDYYEQCPIADRQPHALDILKQDNRAFDKILGSVLREGQADAEGGDPAPES